MPSTRVGLSSDDAYRRVAVCADIENKARERERKRELQDTLVSARNVRDKNKNSEVIDNVGVAATLSEGIEPSFEEEQIHQQVNEKTTEDASLGVMERDLLNQITAMGFKVLDFKYGKGEGDQTVIKMRVVMPGPCEKVSQLLGEGMDLNLGEDGSFAVRVSEPEEQGDNKATDFNFTTELENGRMDAKSYAWIHSFFSAIIDQAALLDDTEQDLQPVSSPFREDGQKFTGQDLAKLDNMWNRVREGVFQQLTPPPTPPMEQEEDLSEQMLQKRKQDGPDREVVPTTL